MKTITTAVYFIIICICFLLEATTNKLKQHSLKLDNIETILQLNDTTIDGNTYYYKTEKIK